MNPRPQAEMPAMSDYGVEEDSWNPLSWEWAAARLSTPRNYWLATVDGNGRPASSPVWGVWDDERLRYAFGCAANSRKARNIAANPQVVLTTEDTVEAISLEGAAELVTDPDRIDGWLKLFVKKYGHEVGPEYEAFMRSNPIYAIAPRVAFAMIEHPDDFATRATRWRF